MLSRRIKGVSESALEGDLLVRGETEDHLLAVRSLHSISVAL